MLRFLTKSNHYYKILTKQQANNRHNILKKQSIQYSFHINLQPGKTYHGLMETKFDFDQFKNASDIFLDFNGNKVNELHINGQVVESNHNKEQGKIELPLRFLKKTDNYVSVSYQNQYDMDGSGCVSFTDVDKKQYLYTQFEPYFANRVFPLFDQPDLKAKMKLALSYPQEWQTAISNESIENQINMNSMERSFFSVHSKFMQPSMPEKYNKMQQRILKEYIEKISKEYKLTSFKQTSLLPCYLYCFVVGPYKRFVCQNTYKNLPMSLYCIESLQKQLTRLRPYIEQMTNKSLQYFEGYFRCDYPFSKYDQVFAHQYKWGAMENAGIVTLNDLYLFKDRVSNQKMLSLGNTIIHQLAHHWFGNLVTMKWWNDLWLNQSFAQYISHFCLEKIKQDIRTLNYESAMLSFYIRKGWGYSEDEMITTHPITTQVSNTHVAESIFDGITYSKGAATMKQLMYLIGEENFSKAIGQYFNAFKFKNTELNDLLRCIQKYFPQINLWKQMWLENAGGNLLTCQWSKKSRELTVIQSCVREQHQTLRIHKINIAYIQKDGSIEKQQITVQNYAEQKFLIPEKANPEAVILNYEDLSFCKISIDSISFLYIEENLHLIKDSLLRAMIWRTLYQMVKDSRMSSSQYLQFVIKNIKSQFSDAIVEEQLGYLQVCLHQYTPEKYREQLYGRLFDFTKKYLCEISLDKENTITILKGKLIAFAYSETHKRQLLMWFNQQLTEFNNSSILKLNTTEKGKALVKFFSAKFITIEEKKTALYLQQSIDKSDAMLKRKKTCDVIIQIDVEKLESIYKSLLKMNSISSTSNYVCIIQGLNNPIHKQLLKSKIASYYYKDLKAMLEQSSPEIDLKEDYKEEFMAYMDPIIDDTLPDLVHKRQSFQNIHPVNDKLRILLLKKIDNLRRREKCYKYFETHQQV